MPYRYDQIILQDDLISATTYRKQYHSIKTLFQLLFKGYTLNQSKLANFR